MDQPLSHDVDGLRHSLIILRQQLHHLLRGTAGRKISAAQRYQSEESRRAELCQVQLYLHIVLCVSFFLSFFLLSIF